MRSCLLRRPHFASRFLLPWFAFATLFVATACAQRTGSIIGQIQVVNQPFPEKRLLVAIDARGIPYTSAYTDNEGKFYFGDLVGNPYQISINDSDFEPVRVTVVVVPEISTVNYVTVSLVPRKREGPRDAGPSVIGGNPNLVDSSIMSRNFPKAALNAYDEGLKAGEAGRLDQAIAKFQKAIALAPEYYPAYNNLGLIYLQRSDFAAAEANFRKVVSLQQADATGLFNLGNVCLLTGRLQESLEHIQAGLKREPNHAFGQFLLGSLYVRLGRLEEAEKALLTALQNDRSMSKVHLELVNLYLREDQPDKAVSQLNTFLKLFPKDPLAPQARTVLARLQGRVQDH
jgi:Flp pilus assembly protein TadD